MKNILLISVVGLAIMGCSPNKASKRTAGMLRAPISGQLGNGQIGGGQLTPTYCGQNYSNIGTIYDQNNQSSLYSSGTFEDRVKALLSATVNPSEVGQISSGPNDQTGVRFEGQIKLDANGNVNLQQTRIIIKVYDSLVLQSAIDGSNQFQAIPIEFSQASSGQFNLQTGTGFVSFTDQYGEIRFDGNLSGDFFMGQISFRNTTNVTGGAAASGVLGQFYVARCGIIK